MIDAGSGGTRLHGYRWPVRVADPLRPLYGAVTVPEELFVVTAKPGIAAFTQNVSGLWDYMSALLREAEENLMDLRESWYIIPVYLKATAGARNLYQDERDAIFAKLRDVLASSNFRFDSDYWARTISGEEEAVNAWLQVNAIKGTFRADSGEQTWGALDMGGASTQMAFIPKDISIIQNYYPLHLSYVHVHLYSHSFLEFGYRDAHQRLIRLLIKRGQGNGTRFSPVVSPCFKRGLLFTQLFSDTFALGQKRRWVLGTGDMAECFALATELLNTNARCFVPARSREFAVDSRKGACGINGIYEPSVARRKFIAIGQYAKQAARLGMQMDKLLPLSDWMKATEAHCTNGSWETLCWKSIWLGALLHKGLRFPLHGSQMMFSQTLNNKVTGWALGAMMHEVNYYPWRASSNTPGGLSLAACSAAPVVDSEGAWSTRTVACLLAASATALLSFGGVVGWTAARSCEPSWQQLKGMRALGVAVPRTSYAKSWFEAPFR